MARRKQAPAPVYEIDPNRVTQLRFKTPLFSGRAWFKGSLVPYRIRFDDGRFRSHADAAEIWPQIAASVKLADIPPF